MKLKQILICILLITDSLTSTTKYPPPPCEVESILVETEKNSSVEDLEDMTVNSLCVNPEALFGSVADIIKDFERSGLNDLRSLHLLPNQWDINLTLNHSYDESKNTHSYKVGSLKIGNRFVVMNILYTKYAIPKNSNPENKSRINKHEVLTKLAISLKKIVYEQLIKDLNDYSMLFNNEIYEKLKKIIKAYLENMNFLQDFSSKTFQISMSPLIEKLNGIIPNASGLDNVYIDTIATALMKMLDSSSLHIIHYAEDTEELIEVRLRDLERIYMIRGAEYLTFALKNQLNNKSFLRRLFKRRFNNVGIKIHNSLGSYWVSVYLRTIFLLEEYLLHKDEQPKKKKAKTSPNVKLISKYELYPKAFDEISSLRLLEDSFNEVNVDKSEIIIRAFQTISDVFDLLTKKTEIKTFPVQIEEGKYFDKDNNWNNLNPFATEKPRSSDRRREMFNDQSLKSNLILDPEVY
jgi:hypothetical protein